MYVQTYQSVLLLGMEMIAFILKFTSLPVRSCTSCCPQRSAPLLLVGETHQTGGAREGMADAASGAGQPSTSVSALGEDSVVLVPAFA